MKPSWWDGSLGQSTCSAACATLAISSRMGGLDTDGSTCSRPAFSACCDRHITRGCTTTNESTGVEPLYSTLTLSEGSVEGSTALQRSTAVESLQPLQLYSHYTRQHTTAPLWRAPFKQSRAVPFLQFDDSICAWMFRPLDVCQSWLVRPVHGFMPHMY